MSWWQIQTRLLLGVSATTRTKQQFLVNMHQLHTPVNLIVKSSVWWIYIGKIKNRGNITEAGGKMLELRSWVDKVSVQARTSLEFVVNSVSLVYLFYQFYVTWLLITICWIYMTCWILLVLVVLFVMNYIKPAQNLQLCENMYKIEYICDSFVPWQLHVLGWLGKLTFHVVKSALVSLVDFWLRRVAQKQRLKQKFKVSLNFLCLRCFQLLVNKLWFRGVYFTEIGPRPHIC